MKTNVNLSNVLILISALVAVVINIYILLILVKGLSQLKYEINVITVQQELLMRQVSELNK